MSTTGEEDKNKGEEGTQTEAKPLTGEGWGSERDKKPVTLIERSPVEHTEIDRVGNALTGSKPGVSEKIGQPAER